MSREVPILFNGDMVRAILDAVSPKTQTRRPVTVAGYKSVRQFGRSDTPGYDWHFRRPDGCWCDLTNAELCARAPVAPGDTLWVRETWINIAYDENEPLFSYRASEDTDAPTDDLPPGVKWKPSIHMPRAAARLLLPVTAVRCERAEEISEADAVAEGFSSASEYVAWWRTAYPGKPWCWVYEWKEARRA